MKHLIAFNEMQHQVYNYMRHPHQKEPWKIEEFVVGLHERAKASGVEGHFGAAILASLRVLTQ